MALLEKLNDAEVKSVCEKFAFRRSDRMRLLSFSGRCKKALKVLSAQTLAPSKVYDILQPLSFEEILFLRARSKNRLVISRIANFFQEYANVRIKIGGNDLKKLGVKPGPLYAELLRRVLHKKIDSTLHTKKDELEFAKESLKRRAA